MTPRELRATLERLDLSWMDRATATDYATLAPLVMRHADAGDRVGRRIVREAAEQIDELVLQPPRASDGLMSVD